MEPSAAPAYGFNLIDGIIMLVYFVAMIGIGIKFARRNKTTQGYFIGEGKTPSWVLGLSMLAAKISSVTFLALPAAAFALDWRLFVPYLAILPVAAFSVWILVPFYRRAAHTTVFEYLHARFGTGARLYGALVTLMATVIRLGSIIYLVSIPLSMFTGFSPLLIMVVVGLFCTFYTTVGGIQAVIWTDAIQAIILYAGGVIALIVMIMGIPGGFSEIFDVAMLNDKFNMGGMSWNLNDRTFYTMFIVGIFMWISGYTSDQVLIQRYLVAKDLRQARMAGWSSALLCLPTWGLFFFIGTVLYVFYKTNVDPALVGMEADNVLPHFILTQMPHGLSGLVIAGIVSAAMGSLSAALNVFSTISTIDIIKPYLLKNKSDRVYMLCAKGMTLFAAFLMFTIGYLFMIAEKESFLDLSTQINGLIGGVVPAFFLLGLFVIHVNRRILWQAFPFAFVLNVYFVLVEAKIIPAFYGFKVHPYLVSGAVITFMIVLALVLARIQRIPADKRLGYSVWHPLPANSKLSATANSPKGIGH